jgi:hypothetical protein
MCTLLLMLMLAMAMAMGQREGNTTTPPGTLPEGSGATVGSSIIPGDVLQVISG